MPSRHLVRFCAVVRFLCVGRPRLLCQLSPSHVSATEISSSATTSPLHIVGSLTPHSASIQVRGSCFLNTGEGSWRVGADPVPQKSRSSSPIPQSVLHPLLHPPLHPPLHLHLFTALVADVAYQVTTTGTVTTSSVSLVLAGSSSLWLDFDFATASKMITFLRFAARLLFLGHSSTPTSR